MNLNSDYLTTLKTYSKIAKKWDSMHPDQEYQNENFNIFKSYLKNGSVIEVGCGAGRDSEQLTKLGFSYLGTDAVPEFVEVASKNYPDRTFSLCSVQNLNTMFLENTFDGFWASAVLLHIPKEELKSSLDNLKFITKPNSIGFISIQKGKGQKFEVGNNKTDGLGRLFVYYSKEEFESFLKKSGFKVLFFKEKERKDRPNWLHFIVMSTSKYPFSVLINPLTPT